MERLRQTGGDSEEELEVELDEEELRVCIFLFLRIKVIFGMQEILAKLERIEDRLPLPMPPPAELKVSKQEDDAIFYILSNAGEVPAHEFDLDDDCFEAAAGEIKAQMVPVKASLSQRVKIELYRLSRQLRDVAETVKRLRTATILEEEEVQE